jgi:dihydrofolate reductase (trimethoprim resistance protein)
MIFALKEFVEKKSGAKWRGHIVGSYQTNLTNPGWAVESYFETGSVQIYPETALRPWIPPSADRRQFSDALAEGIIKTQVKEIDRLHAVIKQLRTLIETGGT